jgi:hypothetical protein
MMRKYTPRRIRERDERLNAEYSRVPTRGDLLDWLNERTNAGEDADYDGMVLIDVVRFISEQDIRNAMYQALPERDDDGN